MQQKGKGGVLFVVSAASGAGKSSLVAAVLERLDPLVGVERVVTYTTRQPRDGERSGIDYHFVASAEFERRQQAGFFFEWSSAYGASYGSPCAVLDVVRAGSSRIAILDRVGAEQVVSMADIRSVLLWIDAPSSEELSSRLAGRGTESARQVAHRLACAEAERARETVDPIYTYRIVNDDLARAAGECVDIVMRYLHFRN